MHIRTFIVKYIYNSCFIACSTSNLTNNPYADGHGFDAKTCGVTGEGKLLRHNGKLYPNPLGVPVLSIDYEGSK